MKMRGVYLSPSEHDELEWAESIIAVENGLTIDMLQALENEPDLIYTADAAGETVLHVLARADLGDAITISTCSTIMEIVGKGRMNRVLLKKNTNGDTPLHLAVKKKDQELAYWLVLVNYKAAFVHNKDKDRPLELIEAARYSKVLEKIPTRVLVLQGFCADPEMDLVSRDIDSFENPSKAQKWIYAIPEHARQDFLRASRGVINGKHLQQCIDASSGNILHWAATNRCVGLLRLLKNFTSNSDLASLALETDRYGDLPLHRTFEAFNDKATALYLIQVASMAAYFLNRKGVTPLYLAIEQGCEDLVREIFQLTPGTAIDASLRKNLLSKNASVIHAAVRCGNPGILGIIMKELPSSIDSLDEQGWRPLSYAAYEGYSDAVFYFLRNSLNSVTRCDLDGSLPMHKAVAGGHVSIVEQFILRCPSTIYHLDNKGQSILHIAVRYAKDDVFSYLTKKKEVTEIFYHKDHEGRTFADLAYELKTGRTTFRAVNQ